MTKMPARTTASHELAARTADELGLTGFAREIFLRDWNDAETGHEADARTADELGLARAAREAFLRDWMAAEAEHVADALAHGLGPFGEP